MNVLSRLTLMLVGALTLAVLTANAYAGKVMTVTVPLAKQAALEEYWTAERLANTPAFPMPVDYGDPTPVAVEAAQAAFLGKAGSTAGGMGAVNADQVAQTAYPASWAAGDEESVLEAALAAGVPTGTSGRYTSFDVNRQSSFWKVYPHKWSGRLSFSAGFCSATAISGNNIVTAAHCVYDTGANRFYSNWVFTPAYRNGNAPYGTFTASACTILTAWANLSGSYNINTWAKYDVAVCTLNKNSAGQTINQAVGFAGRAWNFPYEQLNFNNGYPFQDYNLNNIVNAGAYLRACINESFQQATDVLGGGCNWGPGISGGGWLLNYKPFIISGNVNSVNSGLFAGQQNLYGARFTSNNIVPVCNARGC